MLLPQSAAFAALKNRLNSVSAIGYLHIAPRPYVTSPSSSSSSVPTRAGSVTEIPFLPYRNGVTDSSHTPRNSVPASTTSSTYDRPNRLKGRDEGIRWAELLDKFRSVQERARRAQRTASDFDEGFLFPDDKNNQGLDTKTFNNLTRLPGPPTPMKDTTPAPPVVSQRAKLGLGKFARLGAGPSKLKK